jgi:hypothetical protein
VESILVGYYENGELTVHVRDLLVINRDDAFWMVLRFTDQLLPNDPRQ